MEFEELAELINGKVRDFNERAETDEKMAKELDGVTRRILIDLGDQTMYLLLDEQRIKVVDGFDEADIRITSTVDVIGGVFTGDISPMRAMLLDRTLKVDASLEDKLRLQKLLK